MFSRLSFLNPSGPMNAPWNEGKKEQVQLVLTPKKAPAGIIHPDTEMEETVEGIHYRCGLSSIIFNSCLAEELRVGA